MIMANFTVQVMELQKGTTISKLYIKTITLSIATQLENHCQRVKDRLTLMGEMMQQRSSKNESMNDEPFKMEFALPHQQEDIYINSVNANQTQILNREKRFIVVATIAATAVVAALALGAYSAIEVTRLSSQVDAQQQQLEHILVAVEGVHEVLEQNAEETKELRTKANEIILNLNNFKSDQMMLYLAHITVLISQQQLNTMEQMIEGIFRAMAGQMSPALLSGVKTRNMIKSKQYSQCDFEAFDQGDLDAHMNNEHEPNSVSTSQLPVRISLINNENCNGNTSKKASSKPNPDENAPTPSSHVISQFDLLQLQTCEKLRNPTKDEDDVNDNALINELSYSDEDNVNGNKSSSSDEDDVNGNIILDILSSTKTSSRGSNTIYFIRSPFFRRSRKKGDRIIQQ